MKAIAWPLGSALAPNVAFISFGLGVGLAQIDFLHIIECEFFWTLAPA